MRPATDCVLLWESNRKSSLFSSVAIPAAPRSFYPARQTQFNGILYFFGAAGRLAARSQAFDQRKRQSGFFHPLLNRGNIVRHPPEFDDLVVQIEDGQRGARVAVARLSDRTGIQQIACARLEAQGAEARAMVRAQLNHSDLPGPV